MSSFTHPLERGRGSPRCKMDARRFYGNDVELSIVSYCDRSTKQLFVFVWLCIVLRCWLLLSVLFNEPIREPLLTAAGGPSSI